MSDIKRTGDQGGPSSNEEEYFARRDAELMRQQREVLQKSAAEAERKSHYMKCPKCGFDLITVTLHGVELDQCTNCHGLWFDAGEAEAMLKRGDDEQGLLRGALLSIVKAVSGARAKPK